MRLHRLLAAVAVLVSGLLVSPIDAAPPAPPPHLDSEGKLLPQTDAKPTLDSPAFQQNLAQLVEAIAKDDPALARPFFFPVEAYEVVKAIQSPAKDWKNRLYRAFERNVHEYHRKLKDAAAGTTLVRLDVPAKRAKWMKPGSEGNAIGYWRVTRSHLILADGRGKAHDFELTSMISWRGEWYVVHLNGFK